MERRGKRPPADRGSHADPRDYNFIEIKTQVIKDNIKLIIQGVPKKCPQVLEGCSTPKF